MHNKIIHNVIIVGLLMNIFACTKPVQISINKDLSLFAFIISDNNLDDHTEYIEADMVKGLKGCPVGTELFLYIDRMTGTPSLRHLFLLESGQVGVKTISEYNERCSTSPDVFRDVLSTMISKSSGRRYGLIYWSHGSGWLPGLNPDIFSRNSTTRSLGADGLYSMDIDDMNSVLSMNKAPDFLVLDACFMGSVEVAYSLRNSTHYLIASPGETLGVGFPYHIVLPELVKGSRESLSHSLDLYLDYCYSDYYGDGTISGMASLIDCTEMDSLASAFKNVVSDSDCIVSPGDIQAFDCSNPHLYYDLLDYVDAMTEYTLARDAFKRQLEKTVVKKVTTPSIFTQTSGRDSMLTIERFSGLSSYIHGIGAGLDYSYTQTEWYRRCYEN